MVSSTGFMLRLDLSLSLLLPLHLGMVIMVQVFSCRWFQPLKGGGRDPIGGVTLGGSLNFMTAHGDRKSVASGFAWLWLCFSGAG